MKNFSIWLKLCVFNFFVVSVVGVMMRYNMAFSLPGLTHKFTQEAHSHFAFYGWVSASIYLFVTKYLSEISEKINFKKYQFLMIANQIGSYGMLFTFLYGGYFWLSIVFSSIALFTGFAYFIFLLIDTKSNRNPEIIWLKSGAFLPQFLQLEFLGWLIFLPEKMNLKCFLEPQLIFICIISTTDFFCFRVSVCF